MTTEQIKEFRAFLVKKRLWSEFKREYYKKGNNPSTDINNTLKAVGNTEAIVGTITWSISSRGYYEGVEMWGKVADEWRALFKTK